MTTALERVADELCALLRLNDQKLREVIIKRAVTNPQGFLNLFLGSDDSVWQAMARDGRKIDAIREVRSVKGIGLKEAKDLVVDYVDTLNQSGMGLGDFLDAALHRR